MLSGILKRRLYIIAGAESAILRIAEAALKMLEKMKLVI
jgi:hypothetical protein